MENVLYAAYGSNLHPQRLRLRTASAQLLGTAHLPDWSLRFHKLSVDRSGKCSIEMGSTGVYVAVYEMSARDKQVLDRIEGVGKGYADVTIDVPGFGRCATYIATESHIDEALAPYDWYRELVLLGCRELALPQDYVERIHGVAVLPDPEPRRHEENWRIVKMLRESRGRKR